MILPDINEHERLVLRCYLKNIITVSSLPERLIKITNRLKEKDIKQLAFSYLCVLITHNRASR